MLTRRTVMTTLAAAPLATASGVVMAEAARVIDIEWKDLIPGGASSRLMSMAQLGIVQHGQLTTGFEQVAAVGVTTEFNGLTVRIPGFIVPLEFDVTSVKTFILAPFVGACIHVPPPPANQLIYVESDTAFEITGLYDAVYVTGVMRTSGEKTALADIGYAVKADLVEPFD